MGNFKAHLLILLLYSIVLCLIQLAFKCSVLHCEFSIHVVTNKLRMHISDHQVTNSTKLDYRLGEARIFSVFVKKKLMVLTYE